MMEQDLYEKMADMAMESMVGKVAFISRDQFLAKLRERFPEEAELRKQYEKHEMKLTYEGAQQQVQDILAKAQTEAAQRLESISDLAFPLLNMFDFKR